MTQYILIIIGLFIIFLLLTQKGREAVVEVCRRAVGGQTKQKTENKEKIMQALKEKTEGVSNKDLREALGVSDRTVIRYMDELEHEGLVEQVGAAGKNVNYRLK